jgi:uncharacterized protein YbjT (DUF2867 family)
MDEAHGLTLLTGATGYVGGRLLEQLESAAIPVRCMARRPENLAVRVADTTEVVRGDVFDRDSLARAMTGVSTAYYLVHSMSDEGNFEVLERKAARLFGETARAAGVRRVIYLGGLGSGDELSSHLETRQEVGRLLRESGVPTLELRASIIIGSGSLSFEMIRALVDKLPIMTTPSWVRVLAQPIAIEDVVDYLMEARQLEIAGSRVFEIGGADVVSYADIMQEYADQRGLRRLMIPVPFLTPALSSLWLGIVTPLYARVGRKLIEGVRNPTVVQDDSARTAFSLQPRGMSEAIARALANEDREYARTRWSDAGGGDAEHGSSTAPRGRRIVDSRTLRVQSDMEQAFGPVRKIGGDVGWYFGDSMWRIRGFLDRLVGGPGLRRGRRDGSDLRPGDALDFWRVESIEPDRRLRLKAEMKLPGRAWLEFEVTADGPGSRITQTAIFDPVGLGGLLYWYALLPVHNVMFRGMLRRIVRAAESTG